MDTPKLVLIILAAIFFAFDFFRVSVPHGNPVQRWVPGWTAGAFCLLTIALLLIK
jgi:hypothetical protein